MLCTELPVNVTNFSFPHWLPPAWQSEPLCHVPVMLDLVWSGVQVSQNMTSQLSVTLLNLRILRWSTLICQLCERSTSSSAIDCSIWRLDLIPETLQCPIMVESQFLLRVRSSIGVTTLETPMLLRVQDPSMHSSRNIQMQPSWTATMVAILSVQCPQTPTSSVELDATTEPVRLTDQALV